MESIMIGLNAIFPLTVYMVVGMIAKRVRLVGGTTLTEMNKATFRIFMFCLIFMNSYQVDADSIFTAENGRTLAIALISLAVIVPVGLFISGKMVNGIKKQAVITQACYRSNLVLFGLPITMSIFGEENLGVVSILIAIMVPIYNIIAVFLLEYASGQQSRKKNMLAVVLKNPLVLGSVLGLAFSLCQIRLPALFENTISAMSKVATPLAFFILGGSLSISDVRKNRRCITTVCAARLVVIPAIVLGIAAALGMRGLPLVGLLSAFASPVAVSSFTMAKEMETEPELAGEFVAISTLVSLVTMFCWIVVLNSVGMFG